MSLSLNSNKKIGRKTLLVPPHALFQHSIFNLLRLGQMEVEYNPMAVCLNYFILDELRFHVGKIVF